MGDHWRETWDQGKVFFFCKFIYVFYFGLCEALVAAQASLVAVCRLLVAVASLVAEHAL